MLKEKFSIIEKQMNIALEEVRATFTHSGNKGTRIEDVFAEFLREYLPRRLGIGNGEIVDSKGNRSGQADIVIVNEDHPFTFSSNKPGLFFIEGVSAIGEIKSTLTTQHLEGTLMNAIKYKKLQSFPGDRDMIHANPSDLKRYYEHSPFFLFAYESQLSLEGIGNYIKENEGKYAEDIQYTVDAVFVLNKGWVINFGDGRGALQIKTADGKVVEGWCAKNTERVLFDFFAFLSLTMPKVIKFQPVLMKYIFSGD